MGNMNIQGPGGQQPISAGQTGKAGDAAAVQTGKAGPHTVTTNPNAVSQLTTAGRNTSFPVPVPNTSASARAAAAGAANEAGETDDIDVDKKDEKDDGSELGKLQDAKDAMKRISDADATGKRYYEGFAATLKRLEQFKSVQAYINAANDELGDDDDITQVYHLVRHAQIELGKEAAENLSLSAAEKNKNIALSAGLKAAADQLYSDPEQGPDIRAGINLDATKSEVDQYRMHVLRFKDPANTFKAIVESCNGDKAKFLKSTDFLMDAITQDLNAHTTSTDTTFLHSTQQDIKLVQNSLVVYEESENFCQYATEFLSIFSK